MENKIIAQLLSEIADMLSIEETKTSRFEVRAYRNAALTLSTMQEPIEELYKKGGKKALMELPGIGAGIAGNIEEFINTGKLKKYNELKKKYPIDFKELTSLEGMGAKTAAQLYKSLNIKNIDGLKSAIAKHKIMKLQGFGQRSEEVLAKSITLKESSKGRILLGDALPVAESIIKRLLASKLVDRAVVAGSARRMRETVGDIDILAISKRNTEAMDEFTGLDDVESIISKGPTRTTVWLKIGLSCDLRVLPPESFGAAQQYFIGNREHNIEVRKIAIKKGYKLNEYGLFDSKNKIVASDDEKEIYEKLGLQYMPPEMREARGEIQLALEKKIPRLVELHDLRGDLHTHTKETDGINSIEEMASAAMSMGMGYLGSTNHTKSLKVAKGMDEKGFLAFMKRVDKLNESLDGKFRVLKGAEVEILKDGTLDLSDDVLREMDCVVGSVHSSFTMPEKDMTRRMTRAMETGMMHILGHPTGRLINEREGYAIDMDKVAESAQDNSVALEINSFPSRLDLNDVNILLASKYKVRFAVNSDAHNISHFQVLRYGIGTARRGWLTKDKVINTMPLNDLMRLLKR